MTKRAFDKIREGLDGARAYLDGTADKRRYAVHVADKVDVKKTRGRLGRSGDARVAAQKYAIK